MPERSDNRGQPPDMRPMKLLLTPTAKEGA